MKGMLPINELRHLLGNYKAKPRFLIKCAAHVNMMHNFYGMAGTRNSLFIPVLTIRFSVDTNAYREGIQSRFRIGRL